MTKVTANTLQEALSKAALELGCSVIELDYEVVQYESKGVLGLGKKDAIIIANRKHSTPHSTANSSYNKKDFATQNEQTYTPNTQSYAQNQSYSQSQAYAQNPKSYQRESQNLKEDSSFFDASEFITEANPSSQTNHSAKSATPCYESNDGYEINTSYAPHSEAKRFQTKEEVASEITQFIKEMFSYTPYKIDNISVSFYDNQTLSIYIDGEDSALLIGERGYRYKAISYLLFNWIQPTYGYNIRLEIAQFLQNQEDAIDAYLVGIINEVKREGRAQTKPLDGILAFIALKKLREQFPDKYISFRENPQNERYIIINDFYR